MSHYSAIGDTISCDAPYSAIGFRGRKHSATGVLLHLSRDRGAGYFGRVAKEISPLDFFFDFLQRIFNHFLQVFFAF